MTSLRALPAAAVTLALVAACGTTPSTPSPAPAPAPAAPTSPVAPPPALPGAPPSGSGAAPAVGDATAAVLAIVRATRAHKVRIRTEMTVGGRVRRMTLELVPPDRRHMIMEPGGDTPMHIEMIQVGDHAWRRMNESTPWQPVAQAAAAVGESAANDSLAEMIHKLESGETTVEREPDQHGMTVFHVTDANAGPGGARYDGHLFVGANGLPDHVEGQRAGGPLATSTVHQTFEFDDALSIEPPI